jgi:hypothetical protein
MAHATIVGIQGNVIGQLELVAQGMGADALEVLSTAQARAQGEA